VGERKSCPCLSVGETIAQTVSRVHLRLCEESVASVELQHSKSENIPSPFPRAEDSHSVDVTGKAAHQLCSPSLKDEVPQGPPGLSRDKNQHLLLVHPGAVVSTEDLDSLDS